MMDDIRSTHSSLPTAEEADWMTVDAVGVIVRALALAGVALAIGVSASIMLEGAEAPQSYVAAGTR
jgi:hypothetical protein